MSDVFIIAAKRTPIGSYGGVFKNISATELGIHAVKALFEESTFNIKEHIDELFFGNVVSSNLGQAPATQVAIGAGLPLNTASVLINKVCASGLKATVFGAQSIQLGQADLVVTGGMESMSNIPYYLDKARFGYGYDGIGLTDGLSRDGLTDAYNQKAMGCFGDSTAQKYAITREQQDEYAKNSYTRSAKHTENGNFKTEITPVEIKNSKKDSVYIIEDEEYKKAVFEKIPNLKPAFSSNGTITAANASTINDGAAALLLASEKAIKEHNIKPIARIISYADAQQEPEWFTTAPILATQKALDKANLNIKDIDFFEINEAFAVVPMAFAKHFKINYAKINIFGGAVAIGHPLGCSGARIIVTLSNILRIQNGKYGIAAICNGGGGASAILIERL